MYNWQAILNNQTFTHADFNGTAYVDGLPSSLEALGDHVLARRVTDLTVNGSFNPASATATVTVDGPTDVLYVGQTVSIHHQSVNARWAIGRITAIAGNQITYQRIDRGTNQTQSSGFLLSPGIPEASLEVGNVNSRGWGASEMASAMTMFGQNYLRVNSLAYPNRVTTAYDPSLMGWLQNYDAGAYRTLDGYAYPADWLPTQGEHRVIRASALRPFDHGMMILDGSIVSEVEGDTMSWVGLSGQAGQIMIRPESVLISLGQIYEGVVRTPGTSRVVMVWSPNANSLQIFENPGTAPRLLKTLEFSTRPQGLMSLGSGSERTKAGGKLAVSYNYIQQTFRL